MEYTVDKPLEVSSIMVKFVGVKHSSVETEVTETWTFGDQRFDARMRGVRRDDDVLVESNELRRAERDIARQLCAQPCRSGARFRFVRKALGLSAREVAALLGVSAETVSHWENDRHAVPRATWALMGELCREDGEALARLRALGASDA